METLKLKTKIQERIEKLNKKQENVGQEIGIKSKGNFSSKLNDGLKFTLDEITKLAKELKYTNESELIKDTELFCNEKFQSFLSEEDKKDCEIIKLKRILEDYEDEPFSDMACGFLAFFGGMITVLFIFVIFKYLLT